MLTAQSNPPLSKVLIRRSFCAWLIAGLSSTYTGLSSMSMNWHTERKHVRFLDLVKILIGTILAMGTK